MGFTSTANLKRPQDFDDLEGQEFVVSTIRNSIKNGVFAHAYLFAGPRGVGKTTSARLLAKSLNCEKGPAEHPCGKCASCLSIASSSSIDCIEIDGASNTSVEDVRKIRNEMMYPPSSRFKIYIIDEVHMLSNSAFNALLKTIEEPPDHVIFIFATTEIQKVPQTIKSRCQFFRFRPIGPDIVRKRIRKVCSENKVKIDEQSLSYIARESDGSMRDAYTIFDQLSSFCGKSIDFAKIEKELMLTPYGKLSDLIACAAAGNAKGALDVFFNLIASGVSIEQFINDLARFTRSLFLLKCGVDDADALYFSREILSRDEFKSLTVDNLGLALDDLLKLGRDVRLSVNPRFDCELYISNLSRIKERLSNFEIAKRLAAYRNAADVAAAEDGPKPEETGPLAARDADVPDDVPPEPVMTANAARKTDVKEPSDAPKDAQPAAQPAASDDEVFFEVFKDDLL